MQKWEYKIILGNARKLEAQLNVLADDDWEPAGFGCTTWNGACLLRRPKPQPKVAGEAGTESERP